jgi:large subunit ribosomal protein L15
MTQLKRTTQNKKAKLVGRGGTRGKTSGRGTKGQNARAGHKNRPEMRDIIKKLPKLRGRGKNVNKAFRIKATPINLTQLVAVFEKGAFVTPATLIAAKLVKRSGGKTPYVKILASGEIDRALSFYDVEVSAAAKAKIEAAGGTVNG